MKRKPNMIRAWLKKRGVPVITLARELGVSETLVHNCISGKNDNRGVLRHLVGLGCPPAYLDLPDDPGLSWALEETAVAASGRAGGKGRRPSRGRGKDGPADSPAEYQLLVMADRAKAAHRAKREFLANMSHEIRTPLNGILGMLQLLQFTCLDEEQTRYVDLAIQSGSRLNRLLTDILDLSRVEADRLAILSLPFGIADVFRSLEHLFRPVALQGDVTLEFSLDPGIPATLLGDATRIQQVLSNLVGNSLKYTPSGFVRVAAQALAPDRKGLPRVLFSVEDSGTGIADDILATLFEPFSQGDARLSRKHQGAGLGLAICKRLVGLMGGTMSVDSGPGAGTTFCFSATFGRDKGGGLDRAGEGGACPNLVGGLRVLLAEDDTMNAMTVQWAMERLGHRVVLARDGEACLEALAAQDFDLVLMDIMMPVMDGLETVRAIRDPARFGDKAGIPVIALTAHAMRGDREKFLAAGMDGYLSKPLVLEEVERTVARVLAGRGR
jgi:signal transduction histidine kinase/CheY-like chemotaxis protein